MRLLDFFAGIGAFTVGFRQHGFTTIKAYDIDRYACATYRANVGDHIDCVDITTQVGSDLPRSDVWTFGFPCTDISIAGQWAKHQIRGFDAPRTGLFNSVMELLDEIAPIDRPTYLVAENVTEVKHYLPRIKAAFGVRGYSMQARPYHATQFDLPQNRTRYIIVGTLIGSPEPELTDPPVIDRPRRLYDVLDASVDTKYRSAMPVHKWRTHALDTLRLNPPQCVLVGQQGADSQTNRVHHPAGIAPTIMTGVPPRVWLGGTVNRRLTPTECGRLQGFPMDDWRQVVSDNQAYKQFGNSVPVPLCAWIAKAIKRANSNGDSRDMAEVLLNAVTN